MGTEFEVQQDLNAEVYSRIEAVSDFVRRTMNEPTINLFVENRDKLIPSDLVEFLRETGADYKKDNEIYEQKIDSAVIISGWFDIIGQLVDTDKTETFVRNNGESTINFRFSQNETYGMRPELKSYQTFRMSFDLVLH